MAAAMSLTIRAQCLLYARGLALTTPNFKDELSKRARVMEKLLNRGKKKKYYGIQMEASGPFAGPVRNTRRTAVLSNLFMENITDIMSTEECGSQLQGYGIEVTYVKVPADCKVVNVYWTLPSSNYEQVETVSKILRACAGEIRSEMISRHVLGIVPHINFVQDKGAKNAAEVEKLLSVADYGPDYIPINSGSLSFQDTIADLTASAKEKNDRMQNVSVSDENTNDQESNISSLNDVKEQHRNYEDVCNNLPQMKMNVFRLDYNSIMNQVIHKMKKPYKVEHYEETGVSECIKDNLWSQQNTILNDTAEKRRIILDDFLKERKKLIQANHKATREMLSEYEIEQENNQDGLENSELYVEEDDYDDENEGDESQDYLPQNDEFDNK